MFVCQWSFVCFFVCGNVCFCIQKAPSVFVFGVGPPQGWCMALGGGWGHHGGHWGDWGQLGACPVDNLLFYSSVNSSYLFLFIFIIFILFYLFTILICIIYFVVFVFSAYYLPFGSQQIACLLIACAAHSLGPAAPAIGGTGVFWPLSSSLQQQQQQQPQQQQQQA